MAINPLPPTVASPAPPRKVEGVKNMGFDTRYSQGSRAMESTVPTLGLGGMGVGPELTPDMFRPRQPSRQNSISRSGGSQFGSSPPKATGGDIDYKDVTVKKRVNSGGMSVLPHDTYHTIRVYKDGRTLALDDQINASGYFGSQLAPVVKAGTFKDPE
jgi:hypothetical protein